MNYINRDVADQSACRPADGSRFADGSSLADANDREQPPDGRRGQGCGGGGKPDRQVGSRHGLRYRGQEDKNYLYTLGAKARRIDQEGPVTNGNQVGTHGKFRLQFGTRTYAGVWIKVTRYWTPR